MKAEQDKEENNYAYTSDILKNISLGGKDGHEKRAEKRLKHKGALEGWIYRRSSVPKTFAV